MGAKKRQEDENPVLAGLNVGSNHYGNSGTSTLGIYTCETVEQ